MSPGPKRDAPGEPEKDAAQDLEKHAALPENKKTLSRLEEDTQKTSGVAALRVRDKVKKALEDVEADSDLERRE